MAAEQIARVADCEAGAHPSDSVAAPRLRNLRSLGWRHGQADARRPAVARGVPQAARRVARRGARAQAQSPGRDRAERDVVLRGPPDDAVSGPGDAARRADLRGRGDRRGARGLQPVDSRRHELEGDDDARVSRRRPSGARRWRGSAASSTACTSRSTGTDASSRMPTRTCRAARTTRPPPCTSCASSSTPAMRAALKGGAALALGVDHAQYRHEVDGAGRRARGARRGSRLKLRFAATRVGTRYNRAGFAATRVVRLLEREAPE